MAGAAHEAPSRPPSFLRLTCRKPVLRLAGFVRLNKTINNLSR